MLKTKLHWPVLTKDYIYREHPIQYLIRIQHKLDILSATTLNLELNKTQP